MAIRSTFFACKRPGRNPQDCCFSGLSLISGFIALLCTLYVSTTSASATKIIAQPLPSQAEVDRNKKNNSNANASNNSSFGNSFGDGQKVDITDTGSLWHRHSSMKDQQRDKAQADAEAAKRAAESQKDARQAQIDAYNKYQQMAIDANNQAVSLGKQGKWVEAITAHEKACKFDPQNKQFRINLSACRAEYAQQLLSKGDANAACAMFRQSLATMPDNGTAGKGLINALRKAGYDPNSVSTRLKLGDQLKDSGDISGASIEYNAALQLEPSPRTFIKEGDLAYAVGQVQQAANWYRQAIVKDPDCGAAYRQIGFLEMATKDYTQAAASLRKAVILDSSDSAAGAALVEIWRRQVAAAPNVADNHLGLAGALQLTNDFVGAESEYRNAQAIDPRNPALALGHASLVRAMAHAQAEKQKNAAQALFAQGLKREALSQIGRAVTLEPRNANYQFMFGQCLEAVGDYKSAHTAYLTCVLLDPENHAEAARRVKKMEDNGHISAPQTAQIADKLSTQLAGQYKDPPRQTNQSGAASPATQFSPAAPAAGAGNGAAAPQAMPGNSPYSSMNSPSMPMPSMTMNTKNVFEGGSGAPTLPNSQLAFRTHDESPEAAAAIASQSVPASPVSVSPNNPFAHASAGLPANTAYTMALGSGASAPAGALSAMPGNRPYPGPNLSNPTLEPPQSGQNMLAQVVQAESKQDYASAVTILRQAVNNDMKNADLHHRLAVDLTASNELSEAVAEFRFASALAPTKKEFADDLSRALAANKKALGAADEASSLSGSSSDNDKRSISGLNDMLGANK